MNADTATLSKPGGRKINQDACGFEKSDFGACWAVADGLGGHAGGETASRMAVDAVLPLFRLEKEFSCEGMADCFVRAQEAIRDKAAENEELSDMRTTLVLLACSNDNKVFWAHVGDSRLYWFRQGRIWQQTRDHSVPQMLVDAGKLKPEEIRGHEDQNRLTRAIGPSDAVRPTVLPEPLLLEDGDAALLCSDGIWTWILEREMEEALQVAASAGEWLAEMEKIVLARAKGQFDNYTAIAVLFSKRSTQA